MATRTLLTACAGLALVAALAAPAAAAPVASATAAPAPAPAASAVQGPPEVSAASYVVADAGSGDVLAARDEHEPLPPASTLKLLTALALMGALDPTGEQVATQADAAVIGSKVGLVPGATYTVEQLWQAVFLQSGNDAASALAAAYGGQGPTVRAMQEEARRLGADRTRVAGPSGLDEEGQVSTAHDLAAIGRAALEVPGIVAHATTVRADFPGAMPAPGERRETFEIGTQQDFVREYDGALGLKNGFTSEARNTLVAAAERDGRTLVVTLMRSTGDTDAEAAALMDWGFAHAGRVEPVGALPDAEPRPASGAAAGTGAGTEAPLALAATATASEPAPSLLERAVGALVRLLLVLLLAVAALRARVLLRRRRRRAAARHRRAARAAGSRPPAPRAAQDAEVPSEYADRGRQTASAPWT